jgi:hypothetical protein
MLADRTLDDTARTPLKGTDETSVKTRVKSLPRTIHNALE